jgi:hypothetical protein
MASVNAVSRAAGGTADPVKAVAVVSTGTVEIHPEQPDGTSMPLSGAPPRSRDRASIDEPGVAARSLVGDVRLEQPVRDAVERAGAGRWLAA